MSPRRVLRSLAEISPVLLLVIIIGLAVLATMVLIESVDKAPEANSAFTDGNATQAVSFAPVIVSAGKIKEGSTITREMVKQIRMAEPQIWNDAITTTPDVVGRVAKHSIPDANQIREEDLM